MDAVVSIQACIFSKSFLYFSVITLSVEDDLLSSPFILLSISYNKFILNIVKINLMYFYVAYYIIHQLLIFTQNRPVEKEGLRPLFQTYHFPGEKKKKKKRVTQILNYNIPLPIMAFPISPGCTEHIDASELSRVPKSKMSTWPFFFFLNYIFSHVSGITLCHLQMESHKYSSLHCLAYRAFTFDGVISFWLRKILCIWDPFSSQHD